MPRETGKQQYRLHYCNVDKMSIKSTLPPFSQLKNRKLNNKWISVLGLYMRKCPAFYAGGRSRTGHLTSTRPDRQPAPVDPTGLHLWSILLSYLFMLVLLNLMLKFP